MSLQLKMGQNMPCVRACVRVCVHVFYTVYYVLNETHLASEARSFCLFECSLSHFKHPVSALHTSKKSADSLTEVNVSRATLWTSCSDIRRQSPNQFEDSWQMLLEELWWKSYTLVCARVCVLQMCNYFFKMSLVALCVCVCVRVCVCVCQGRAALRCRLPGGWHLMQAISSFPILMLMKLKIMAVTDGRVEWEEGLWERAVRCHLLSWHTHTDRPLIKSTISGRANELNWTLSNIQGHTVTNELAVVGWLVVMSQIVWSCVQYHRSPLPIRRVRMRRAPSPRGGAPSQLLK